MVLAPVSPPPWTVHLPQLNLVRGLVLGAFRRTEYLSSRRLLPSFFRSLTAFMRLTLCGERTLPMLRLPSSRLRIGLLNRSSACDSRSKTSSRPLRSRVALNSFAYARSSVSWPL